MFYSSLLDNNNNNNNNNDRYNKIAVLLECWLGLWFTVIPVRLDSSLFLYPCQDLFPLMKDVRRLNPGMTDSTGEVGFYSHSSKGLGASPV